MVKRIQGLDFAKTDKIGRLRVYFGAQGLCNKLSFLPSSAFTLSRNFGMPRCCRVTLQPGLMRYCSFSFVRLQGAQALVPKPDCNAKPVSEVRVRT